MSTNYVKKVNLLKLDSSLIASTEIQTESLDPVILADKIEFAINNYDKMIKKQKILIKKIKNKYSIGVSAKKLI